MQSLRHAELKTARALEHLEALGAELQLFYEGKPYTITRFDHAESGRHIIRVQMKDVSDRTAILAGDCVHNLRCALDHAVFSLALDGSSTSEANSTARHAARGRRAHQRWSIEGCPCRIDFSRADSLLIASSGKRDFNQLFLH